MTTYTAKKGKSFDIGNLAWGDVDDIVTKQGKDPLVLPALMELCACGVTAYAEDRLAMQATAEFGAGAEIVSAGWRLSVAVPLRDDWNQFNPSEAHHAEPGRGDKMAALSHITMVVHGSHYGQCLRELAFAASLFMAARSIAGKKSHE